MSVLIMITTLSPLTFLYFLEKYLETRLMWDLFLSLLGLIGTIVSGLLFTGLIVYTINLQLEYLGISKSLHNLDKVIKRMLEDKDKNQ